MLRPAVGSSDSVLAYGWVGGDVARQKACGGGVRAKNPLLDILQVPSNYNSPADFSSNPSSAIL